MGNSHSKYERLKDTYYKYVVCQKIRNYGECILAIGKWETSREMALENGRLWVDRYCFDIRDVKIEIVEKEM